MKCAIYSILSFIIVLFALTCLPGQTFTGKVSAKETWLKVQSKNFTLIGNAGEKEIRKTGARLEQFREVYSRLFSKAKINSSVPITVIVFKDDNSYKPYKPIYQGKPAAVSGYFQPGEDGNYITLSADWRETNPFAVIFHEYVHALTSDNSRPLPPWLSEGIAEYYSSFEIEENAKKVWLGKAIANHVLLLRERQFLPLPSLFAVNHGSPDYNERERKGVFYAQSWALVHFLILGNETKRQPQFRQFINAIANGKPVDDSFRAAFQTDYVAIEKELKDYINRSSYPAQWVAFDEKLSFDAEMQTTPLGEAEVQFYLGDLLWRIQRREEGEEYLKRAIALDPKLAPAQAALGMINLRQKQYSEARKYFAQAGAANSQNYRAYYYYALSLFQEQSGERQLVSGLSDETVKAMRQAIDKTIELAPDFPETYNLLAIINLVRGENLGTAANALKRAMSLAPGREDYALTLAQVYLRQQNLAAARQTLEPIARQGADPGHRASAAGMLETIARIEEQTALAKTARESSEVVGAPSNQTEPIGPPPPVVLRRKIEGEKVRGMLTRIDCSERGMTLMIKVDDRIVKLSTLTPERIQFITYTNDISGQITCGPINPAKLVVATYRGSTDAKAKVDGEPLAVEFVKPDEK